VTQVTIKAIVLLIEKYELQTGRSCIYWVGRKVKGAHNGALVLMEVIFIVNGNQLTGDKS